jgi:GrpB-like predicted nucleotidyltransferase (UPF0157 family)
MAGDCRQPGADAQIAGADEVLKCLTSVLRGDEADDERVTLRDRLRAAELLAKRYGALEATAQHQEVPRIIDDIPASAAEEP